MSLSDFLEKLQNKPKFTRLTIMWIGTAVCMIFIFVLWAWSLESNISQTEVIGQFEEEETESLQEIKQEIPSLWQSLKAGISSFFESDAEDYQEDESNSNPSGPEDKSSKTPPATLPR